MAFEFMTDPKWAEEDKEIKRLMIASAFQDEVASDERWESEPEDVKTAMMASYFQDAEEYEAGLSEYNILGGVKDVGNLIWDLPINTLGAAASFFEDDNPEEKYNWADIAREAQAERERQRMAQPGGEERVLPWLKRKDIRKAGASAGFSAATMTGGLLGAAAGIKGGPLGVGAGSLAGSGLVAFYANKAMFTQQLIDAYRQENPDATPEDITTLVEQTRDLRQKHSLWEAIPEAAGNVVQISGIGALFKVALGKTLGAKIFGIMAGMYGVEIGTEVITQTGQHNVEIEAGLTEGQPRQFNSLDDLYESFKEVAPQTFVLVSLMGAGGAVTGKAYKLIANPESANDANIINPIVARANKGEISVRDAMDQVSASDASMQAKIDAAKLLGPVEEPDSILAARDTDEAIERFEKVIEAPLSDFTGWIEVPTEPVGPIAEEEAPAGGLLDFETIKSQLDERDRIRQEALRQPTPFEKQPLRFEAEIETPSAELETEAQEAATSPLNDLQEPTQAQKDAGNYKKGHTTLAGMQIAIENPRGSTRSGVGPVETGYPEGKPWEALMMHHYGYFNRTEGKDGDQIDVFIGPDIGSKKAFIVDQVNPETGKFDEHKTLLGFKDEESAREGYLSNYEPGWQGLGAITEVPIDEFKEWIGDGTRKTKAYADEITPAVPEGVEAAPEGVAGETTEAKEPWEMTWTEQLAEHEKSMGQPLETFHRHGMARRHREDVKKALSEGKFIPKEVLADYSDLVPPEDILEKPAPPGAAEPTIAAPPIGEVAPAWEDLKEGDTWTPPLRDRPYRIVKKGMLKKGDAKALADETGGEVWIDTKRGTRNAWAVVAPVKEAALPVKPKKPRKPQPSRVRTLRGAINKFDGIKFLNFKGELKDMGRAVQQLSRGDKSGRGLEIDTAVESLIADDYLAEGTSVADFLEMLRTDPVGTLKGRKRSVVGSLEGIPEAELTAKERQFKEELEYEPEAPPEGEYVSMKAADLPVGKELTVLESKTPRGWDVYEVIEKDEFGITLKDGTTIEVGPEETIEVLQTDLTGEAAFEKAEIYQRPDGVAKKPVAPTHFMTTESNLKALQAGRITQAEYDANNERIDRGEQIPLTLSKETANTLLSLPWDRQAFPYGPELVSLRQKILEELTGKKAAKSKSGVNAVRKALFEATGQSPEGKALVQREEEIRTWLGEIAEEPTQKTEGLDLFGEKLPEPPKDMLGAPLEKTAPGKVTREKKEPGETRESQVDLFTGKQEKQIQPEMFGKTMVRLEDFGEKIGGARKDIAEKGVAKAKRAKPETKGPAWRNKYVTLEKIDGSGWTIGRKGARAGIGSVSGRGSVFETEEEADAAIPLYAIADTHSVTYDREEREKWAIYKKVGKRKLFKIVNKTFPSREEGMKYMALNAEDILNVKTTFGEEILPIPEIAVRKGAKRRTGDATPEMFMETFAPRGIEFGNWNNADERQQVLDHAYDGLLDLAEVLNIPPKALMLNGDLAIAFGARGQGLSSAKAHYEPGYSVINLTKMKGAGSLAHEWFHALDNYLARKDTKADAKKDVNERGDLVYNVKSNKYEFQSHGSSYKSKLRPELMEAFDDVIPTMFTKAKGYVEDMAYAEKFLGTARDHLRSKLDEIGTDLGKDLSETYTWRKNKRGLLPASTEQLAEFDILANTIVEGGNLETEYREIDVGKKPARRGAFPSGRQTNDTLEAMSKILKAVRNRNGFDSQNQNGPLDKVKALMQMYSQRLQLFEDAQKGTEKTKKVPTSYAVEAKKMDQARTGDYWSEPHEMAARAFAAYVEDKISEQGNQSDFIVYHAHGGILLPMIDGFIARPYPEGQERIDINRAFDKLLSEIQTRETDAGIELYSTTPGESGITLKDAQALFPGQHVGLSNDGSIWVRTKGGNALQINTVKQIDEDSAAFEIAYGRVGKDGELISGKYQNGAIELQRDIGDRWTLAHESTHWMEDTNIITPKESEILKATIRKGIADGTLKDLYGETYETRNKDDIGGAEDRAEYIAIKLKQRKGVTGTVDRIIQKIQDFIDGLVNLVTRTARGVVRGIESGRIFDRGQRTGVNEFAQAPAMALAKAAKNVKENPAFRRWFGGSKVVDENGDPLVVYHGTVVAFDRFDRGDIGFHFGTSEQANERILGPGYDPGLQVLPVYLSLKNPYDVVSDLGQWDDMGMLEEYLAEGNEGPFTDEEFAKFKTAEDVKRGMERKGYDGIIYDNSFEGKPNQNSYIAFRPEQIKSIYNRGTFDPADPRILYQKTADRWYSQMEKEIAGPKYPNRGTPTTMANLLKAKAKKGQIKQEELEWSGVQEWLKEQSGKVTKQEVLDYLAENNVRVEEVVKGAVTGEKTPDDFIVEDDMDWSGPEYVEPSREYIEEEIKRLVEEEGVSEEQASEFAYHDYAEYGASAMITESESGWSIHYSQDGIYNIFDDNGEYVDQIDTDDDNLSRWSLAKEHRNRLSRYSHLKVGGEGMKGFYDKILPAVANKDNLFLAQDKVFEILEGRGLAISNETAEEMEEGVETKYEGYQLPGGEAYKELLLTLPENQNAAALRQSNRIKELIARRDRLKADYETTVPGIGRQDLTRQIENTGRQIDMAMKETPRDPSAYRGTHFDEPNVLAHIRFNERTVTKTTRIGTYGIKEEEQRILFIEEIQSDWHQAGRKKGYGPVTFTVKEMQPGEWMVIDEGTGDTVNGVIYDNEQIAQEVADTHPARGTSRAGVPDAPFKKAWPLLAIKRMVRYAAENGFDAVAWTPGEVQADRYDLSKHVESIEYSKNETGTYNLNVHTPTQSNAIVRDEITIDQVEELVGKDVAEKIQKGEGKDVMARVKSLTGLDLKVGGEGMKGFYDKILPAAANKFFNKAAWGKAKVGTVEIDSPGSEGPLSAGYHIEERDGEFHVIDSAGESVAWSTDRTEANSIMQDEITSDEDAGFKAREVGRVEVHSLPITPEMRQKVLYEGMPQFTYAGIEAETADKPSFARAMYLDRIMEDPETIRQETGWFLGPDEMWRFEIDDSVFKTTPVFDTLAETKIFDFLDSEVKLGDAFQHPTLFLAYPDIKNVKVRKQSPLFDIFRSTQGWFDREKNEIIISPYAEDIPGTIVHEIQHWIQAKEGFASGGNLETALEAVDADRLKELAKTATAALEEDEKDVSELLTVKKRLLKRLGEIPRGRYGKIRKMSLRYRKLESQGSADYNRFREGLPEGDTTNFYETEFGRRSQEQERALLDKIASLINSTTTDAIDIVFASEEGVPGAMADAQANIDMAAKDVVEITAQKSKIALAKTPEDLRAAIQETEKVNYDVYQDLAGEIESRDVSFRREFTAGDRLDERPYGPTGIPKSAIIRYGAGGIERGEVRYGDRPQYQTTGAQVLDAKPVTYAETRKPTTKEEFELNRVENKSVKQKAAQALGNITRGAVKATGKIMSPISTRMKRISEDLHYKIRDLDFNTNTGIQEDTDRLVPLLKKARKNRRNPTGMTRDDAADWDLARKNSSIEKIDELINKYDLVEEYGEVRRLWDDLHKDMAEVGLEVGYIDEYWSRKVKDLDGLLGEMGREEKDKYTKAIEQRAAALGVTAAELDENMKADIILNILNGMPVGRAGISAAKERKFVSIPARLNKYYMHSDAAAMTYIAEVRTAIEARKWFGKVPEKIDKFKKELYKTQASIRKLGDSDDPDIINARKALIGLERDLKEELSKYASQRDYTDNIATFLNDLREDKSISAKQIDEVDEMLKAYFKNQGPGKFWSFYKNFSLLDTMGSVISAVTQVGDGAWTMYDSGAIPYFKHAAKSVPPQKYKHIKISREDVGSARIGQEFADPGQLAGAVSKVFKMTGLEKIDAIGKESMLNAHLEKRQKQARNNPEELAKELMPMFGRDKSVVDGVISDLQNDDITRDVRFLCYNRLADFQPISKAELPQKYHEMTDGKLLYMLKTFTIKQFDAFRNEAFHKMRTGSKRERIQGLRNLMRLGMFFVIANAAGDEIKDWLLGRDTDFEDRFWDNVLRMAGVSKFVVWKARTEGVASAVAKQILPPVKFIDALGRDIYNAGDDRGLETLSSVPIVGKVLYWWVGRGTSKRDDLWDRRLRKYKGRLKKTKERYERSKDKSAYLRAHMKELRAYRNVNKFQGRLNKYRKRINELKGREETHSIVKRIKQLEKRRTEMIKMYLANK